MVHDLYTDIEARACVAKIMGQENLLKFSMVDGQQSSWLEVVEEYHFHKAEKAKSAAEPWLHYQYMVFKESVDNQCGEHVSARYSNYDNKVHLYLKGWYDSEVPHVLNRLRDIGVTFLVTVSILGIFFSLKKWVAWVCS